MFRPRTWNPSEREKVGPTARRNILLHNEIGSMRRGLVDIMWLIGNWGYGAGRPCGQCDWHDWHSTSAQSPLPSRIRHTSRTLAAGEKAFARRYMAPDRSLRKEADALECGRRCPHSLCAGQTLLRHSDELTRPGHKLPCKDFPDNSAAYPTPDCRVMSTPWFVGTPRTQTPGRRHQKPSTAGTTRRRRNPPWR